MSTMFVLGRSLGKTLLGALRGELMEWFHSYRPQWDPAQSIRYAVEEMQSVKSGGLEDALHHSQKSLYV